MFNRRGAGIEVELIAYLAIGAVLMLREFPPKTGMVSRIRCEENTWQRNGGAKYACELPSVECRLDIQTQEEIYSEDSVPGFPLQGILLASYVTHHTYRRKSPAVRPSDLPCWLGVD